MYQMPASMTEKYTTNLVTRLLIGIISVEMQQLQCLIEKMDGPGQIVQIDKSLLQGQRKYKMQITMYQVILTIPFSKKLQYFPKGSWTFGMCCKNVTGVLERQCFEVEKRDKANFLTIFQNGIELGTIIIIYSDQRQAYTTLIYIGYQCYHNETIDHCF